MKGPVFSLYRLAFFWYGQSVRYARHKPWIPQFKLLRRLQPWDGPIDVNADRPPRVNTETTSEMRQRLRRNGLLPPIIFHDRPINIGHTGQVTDPYVPPEGDGRSSLLSSKRIVEEAGILKKKGKSYREAMRIRRHEPSFTTNNFVNEAESIYKEAHELLQDSAKNESRLLDLVTEKALVDMTTGLKFRTFRWNFVQSIEPPRVVQVRTQELMNKDNLFGQVTVRFHTQQTVAIFDRFGRLLYGNPVIPVDVLEYVVFEKHITDEYGIWRMHAKIRPSGAPPLAIYHPTQRLLPPKSDAQNTAVSEHEPAVANAQ